MASDPAREKALSDYKKKLIEHREVDSKLKELRLTLRDLNNQYEKSENDLKALQSVGQIVGEVSTLIPGLSPTIIPVILCRCCGSSPRRSSS